jgi:purine nucleosidase
MPAGLELSSQSTRVEEAIGMTRIILDTDLSMGEPGSEIDDGFALALAVAGHGIQLELVSAVSGNTDVETATLLCLDLVERLGRRDIPVVRGAAAPLMWPDRARRAPAQITEKYGHRSPTPGYAAQAIADLVMSAPGEITVVAIGPLSNIAAAMALEPRLAASLGELVVMGGVFLGQTQHSKMPGEFNVWSDPEAAHAVLRSGAAMRWVGLDVTRRVRLTREHAAQMTASPRPFGSFAGTFTTAWIDRQKAEHPGADPALLDSCAMNDPLAVAAVARPDLVTWSPAHLDVVTGNGIARGVIVADLLTSVDAPEANCRIATAVDVRGFMEFFLAAISAL